MTKNRPRVLVLTSTFPRWSNDTNPSFVYDLCVYLQNSGIQIDVLAPHTDGAKKFETLDGVNIIRYQYFIKSMQSLTYSGGILSNLKKNPLNYLLVPLLVLSQIIAIHSCLKRANYNLIHAHWVIPQGICCAILRMLSLKKIPPFICTSHGSDLFALNNKFFKIINKWVINNTSHLCVVSNALKRNALRLNIASNKLSVVPMGTDLKNVFKPVSSICRRNSSLIYVGRLNEKKGVNTLLQAMVKVVKVEPDAELIIIGDGPLRVELQNSTHSLAIHNNVKFYGSIIHNKLPELYSAASIAIVPSVAKEGLGLVIIEAMGCKCAVIASENNAFKDIIDSTTGVFVTPGDADMLADAICELIKNKEQRLAMVELARTKVLKKFDWEIVGEEYYNLILARSCP